jgi:hypothetical protein
MIGKTAERDDLQIARMTDLVNLGGFLMITAKFYILEKQLGFIISLFSIFLKSSRPQKAAI